MKALLREVCVRKHRRGGTLCLVVIIAMMTAGTPATQAPGAPRLFAIFVVDGLRPDSINTTDSPTIARLRSEGADYVNSHSVFPTVTRVNTAVLASGFHPAQTGIVGNSMFVEGVNAKAAFDNGDQNQLLKLEEVSGRAVTADTLGEVLQNNGRKLVTLSSGSNGNGFLLNPQARHGAGVAVHGLFKRGETAAFPKEASDAILARFGPPPAGGDETALMNWTDTVLRDYVLPDLRPDVIIDWMGPLDGAQHSYGVGSPQAKEALQHVDGSIARTLATIESLGLKDRVNVIVTSDHGFAHHKTGVDVTDALVRAGLKAGLESTDVIVASQSQSVLLYVQGHAPDRIDALAKYLQQQPWTDLVFTRGGRDGQGSTAGTFSLDFVDLSHPSRGPDVAVSLAWNDDANAIGIAGSHTIDSQTTGPLSGPGSGHGGLNPWVVHNAFVAWGADFRTGTRIEAPVSLADVAPTILKMLGIDPDLQRAGRGRVLRELMKAGPAADLTPTRRIVTTSAGAYRASLQISTVDEHDYIDGGSRQK